MQVCDVCGTEAQVKTHPWGAQSDQRDRGTFPIGRFDLCVSCGLVLKEGGLRALIAQGRSTRSTPGWVDPGSVAAGQDER